MSDHREAIAEVIRVECFYGGLAEDADDYRRMADAMLGSDVLAQIRAEARAEALDAVLTRADDGIEFGPPNTILLRRIVRDVRAMGSA